MKPLPVATHTVRCPLEDRSASVTVRTDPDAPPSRRNVAVTACSLHPGAVFAPPPRPGFFSDVAPPAHYLGHVDPKPCHADGIPCASHCLGVLNAAEPGAAAPVRCTSGVSDSFELARQTQSPAIMRALWLSGI